MTAEHLVADERIISAGLDCAVLAHGQVHPRRIRLNALRAITVALRQNPGWSEASVFLFTRRRSSRSAMLAYVIFSEWLEALRK